ncbi:GNAT family N-acetyltransferase [Micromonospora sp. NBC_01796]|uniref:GNAT family N-acetyltransferase n=1 Tax=Micromonospora sp. NBC_01796 TaxID=2975987 RepID=UPI002DD83348|nr:GNAT family N-acetyltransferase [Micromonospora sp. NBC_01796]WSA89003.1 GNAT family N-acetyltransferase [Micromonospora sp. NBC_01796]
MDHDFSIIELTDDDVPSVVALCGEALDLPDDAAEAGVIVARLRDTTTLPGAPTRRRTVGFVAVVGSATVGVVLGSIAHRDSSLGHVDLIAVHPTHRRRGIGRALLARIEGALSGLGAGEVLLAGNPPHYVWPGIDVRYTPAICAAMALGYQQENTAWNMTADLSYDESPALRSTESAEQRLAEQGITVRRAEPDDAAMLVGFAQETFGVAWGGEVADSIGRTGAGCHIAVRDRVDTAADSSSGTAGSPEVEVLGFAAYGSSRPSWFGPMGTAPAAQGLGIGGVLLRRCLADQRAAGHQRAEIGWVGPVPFYASNSGARIERVFFLYRKQL